MFSLNRKRRRPLSLERSISIVKKKIRGRITGTIKYGNSYVFIVINDSDPLEGNMDPYYAVDINTGKVSDFSIFIDGRFSEIMDMFENHNLYSEE